MQAKYSEVKQLIDRTNWDNKVFEGKNEQPFIDELGIFSPANNNWSYRFGIAKGSDDQLYYVVTVYGQVRGYRRLHI